MGYKQRNRLDSSNVYALLAHVGAIDSRLFSRDRYLTGECRITVKICLESNIAYEKLRI